MSYKLDKPYSVEYIANIVGGEVVGDDKLLVNQVASLETANSSDISFCKSDSKESLKKSNAGIVLVEKDNASLCPNVAIIVSRPRLAFVNLLNHFLTVKPVDYGVSERAIIGQNCQVDVKVKISHNVVIGDNCKIANNVKIAPGCVIGDNVILGDNTVIESLAIIYSDTQIGKNCVIGANSVIGKSGFGFEKDESLRWVKVPQLGRVILEDNVEVGVNSSIDRGAIGDTILRSGVKCDNLVQIGHNTIVGENTLICGCAGIAGSVSIGKNCILAGGAMVADNISITSNVVIAGAGAVRKNITKSGQYAGDPVRPLNQWLKDCVNIASLSKLKFKLKQLETNK